MDAKKSGLVARVGFRRRLTTLASLGVGRPLAGDTNTQRIVGFSVSLSLYGPIPPCLAGRVDVQYGLLDVRRQRLVHRPPRLERHQDLVGRDRRATEDLVAHRRGDGVHDRAEPGADRRLAHAARTAIPLHRQGMPKECADLVLFLASDEASFISGAEIAIDGGYIAAGTASLRNKVRDDFAARRG